MKANKLFSPALLVPLTLLTPYVFVAQYGISVLELVVFSFVLLILIRPGKQTIPHIPTFLFIFLCLYAAGFLGALINGALAWGVPVGYWNMGFFYKLLLALGAFWLGTNNTRSIAEILKNRWVKFAILALCILALVYPFLSFDFRMKYLSVFFGGEGIEENFHNPRMPGVGINNVIYSFMLVCFLIVSFQAFLNKNISLLIPTALLLTILSLSSKLAIGLGVLSCFILFLAKIVPRHAAIPYRNIKLLAGLGLIVLVAGFILTQTEFGLKIQQSYATVQRFEAAFAEDHDEPVGFELRFLRWAQGIERVQLAPLLGIAKDPFLSQEGPLVGFYKPHSEWIRIWMFYGMAGLVAWLLLVTAMIILNMKNKIQLEWVLLYFSFVGFMLYDGGVDAPRFVPFWFYLIGLNYSLIRK